MRLDIIWVLSLWVFFAFVFSHQFHWLLRFLSRWSQKKLDNLKQISADKDAAQRISDCVNLHLVVAKDIMEEAVGMWCAFKLEDGSSDGNLYPSKEIAIDHQKGIAKNYFYMKITPDGIRPQDALRLLRINRLPHINTIDPEHLINPRLFPPAATVLNPDPRPGVDSE